MGGLSQPFLCFDFAGRSGAPERVCYQDPVEVIRADRVDGVLPALRAVQAQVAAGRHAAGYLAYEAAPAFDPALTAHPSPRVPFLWFGIFEGPARRPRWPESGPFEASDWRAPVDATAYESAIGRIREAIAAGETYQLNYTMPLRAGFTGSAFALYERLRRAQSGGYAAWLDTGRHAIVSASPEPFFRWDGDRIEVRPMKGTAPRGRWAEEDDAIAAALRSSEKERAENVMIVDLMRSDLGRVARPGSVRVRSLFDVERYPTVHQMTSHITARTRPGTDIVDVLRALFPSGSVTGAPKASTMDLIRRLEPEPRNVYCGAIGYIRPDGECVFSVPIRTVLIDPLAGTAEYGVGGGITWDSSPSAEYAEAWLKARLLTEEAPEFRLLESLLLRDGFYHLLERHTDRLASSARYFGFDLDPVAVDAALAREAATRPDGAWKARLTVAREGAVSVETEPLTEPPSPLRVAVAPAPVGSRDRFLYHKTTHRAVYDRMRGAMGDAFDVLLWNERGEWTEFTTGNLVLEIGGRRYTPPRECGLLAGTFRTELLERGEISERVLRREDLRAATRVWFINSVRGWREVSPIPESAGP